MSNENIPKRLLDLLGNWKGWVVCDKIGEGSFGTVYRIKRQELNSTYWAALKWIHLPLGETDVYELQANHGMSDASIREYYSNMATELQSEVNLLRDLRVGNVVSYEDHFILRRENGIDWDILIRMELLADMNRYFEGKNWAVSEKDVVTLGIGLCSALEACHDKGIIHRDIKPANIFVDDDSGGALAFKLGDFGIARKMNRDGLCESRRGTFEYMAPEVYKGKPYDKTVDIYSLGVVMYRMMNARRLPFYPPYPQPILPQDAEDALVRRMNGSPLPRPIQCQNNELWAIISRACDARRKARYQNAGQMLADLRRLRPSSAPLPIPRPPRSVSPTPTPAPKPIWPVILAGVAALLAVAGFLAWKWMDAAQVKNLRLVARESSVLELVWEGGGGEWTVEYAPRGAPARALSTKLPSVKLTGLIPDTPYQVAVAAGNGKGATGEFETDDASPLTGETRPFSYFDTVVLDEGLYAAARSLLGAMPFEQAMDEAGRKVDSRRIALSAADAQGQDSAYAYLLNLIWSPTASDKAFALDVVLRLEDGRAFIEAQDVTCPGEAEFVSLYANLDGLLGQVWEACAGQWPEQGATIEIYLDGYRACEADCRIASE